jgi:hypothetical protein
MTLPDREKGCNVPTAVAPRLAFGTAPCILPGGSSRGLPSPLCRPEYPLRQTIRRWTSIAVGVRDALAFDPTTAR